MHLHPEKIPSLLLLPVFLLALAAGVWAQTATALDGNAAGDEGIRFVCQPGQLERIGSEMAGYLAALGIASDLVVTRADAAQGTLTFTLNTPRDDTDTLNLKDRPELKIRDEVVTLPARGGKTRTVRTVSKKEIVLAMLQHGRLTEFKGGNCRIGALKDHVGVRQNTVAWAEKMDLVWPDGGFADWNGSYWKYGKPRPGVPLHAALNDLFSHQHKYAIGCYTAAKIVMIQGVLDYYRRIARDNTMQKRVEARLWTDQEPLVGIEPGAMWSFEADFDPRERARPGKILRIAYGIAARNFIPGDWAYLRNTDPVSARKVGYEGSNAIYLGRNRLVDLYNDHGHFYTVEQKLDEVYQWRNGVFSRSRDAAKIKPLSRQEMEALRNTPERGGLLMDFRVSHYLFGADGSPQM